MKNSKILPGVIVDLEFSAILGGTFGFPGGWSMSKDAVSSDGGSS